MQSAVDASKNLAAQASVAATQLGTQLGTHATNLANQAAEMAGYGHSHAEEHLHRSTLPPDAEVGPVMKMDSDGLAVFEAKEVRHEVLVKINQLAIDDAKHGLKEVASLDLYVEGGEKKGISFYHPLRFFTVKRPQGLDYIGEVEIEQGKSLHIRCHRPGHTGPANFHSIDTRPSEEGGAVFVTGEQLGWFDY